LCAGTSKDFYYRENSFDLLSLLIPFLQNMLGQEGMGFKIAMGAFDRTRPPVRAKLFNIID
jgi:hypothetical protein